MRYGVQATDLFEWLALRAHKVPMPVMDLIVAPMQARSLLAAGQIGLLAALADGPAESALLASRLSVDHECLVLVLRVLRAMGYVDLEAARWSLSAQGERYFGKQATEPSHSFVEYGLPQWRMLEQLDGVLRTGVGLEFHASHTAEEWDAYQRAMMENAAVFAWFVAENLPVPPGATRCLDLAGSHGLVGAALCARHPGLTSTVLDLPPAVAVARRLAEERGYTDKVAFRAGDLVKDEYDVDQDVVLLCNILHHFPVETNRAILAKVHAALRPGGVVGIFDIEVPEASARPEAAADAFALYFRIISTSACFRGRDYEAWLDEAGFRSVRTVRSIKMPSRMLVLGER